MKEESRTLFEQVNALPMEERRAFASNMVRRIKDEDARRADAFTEETDSILNIVSTAKYRREEMAKAPVVYTFTAPAQRAIEVRNNPYGAIQMDKPARKDNSARMFRIIAAAAFIVVCIAYNLMA